VRQAEFDRFLEMTDGLHGRWLLGPVPEGRHTRRDDGSKPCTSDRHGRVAAAGGPGRAHAADPGRNAVPRRALPGPAEPPGPHSE
jgi:hypothetical protein